MPQATNVFSLDERKLLYLSKIIQIFSFGYVMWYAKYSEHDLIYLTKYLQLQYTRRYLNKKKETCFFFCFQWILVAFFQGHTKNKEKVPEWIFSSVYYLNWLDFQLEMEQTKFAVWVRRRRKRKQTQRWWWQTVRKLIHSILRKNRTMSADYRWMIRYKFLYLTNDPSKNLSWFEFMNKVQVTWIVF